MRKVTRSWMRLLVLCIVVALMFVGFATGIYIFEWFGLGWIAAEMFRSVTEPRCYRRPTFPTPECMSCRWLINVPNGYACRHPHGADACCAMRPKEGGT